MTSWKKALPKVDEATNAEHIVDALGWLVSALGHSFQARERDIKYALGHIVVVRKSLQHKTSPNPFFRVSWSDAPNITIRGAIECLVDAHEAIEGGNNRQLQIAIDDAISHLRPLIATEEYDEGGEVEHKFHRQPSVLEK